MKVFAVSFFLVLSLQSLYAQKWNYGFGLEINRMSLATRAPDVKVPYTIQYTPNYGFSGMVNIEYHLNDIVTITLNPSYGYWLNNWKNFVIEEAYLKVNHLNLGLGSRFKFWRFIIGQDIGLSRVIGIFTKTYARSSNIKSSTNISYLAENRNIFYSSLYFGFNLYKQSFIHLKGTYYHNNLFISNGFDRDFNLVGPIFQRPIVLSAGINVNFGNLKSKTKKLKYISN